MSIPLLDEFFLACEVAGRPSLSIGNPRTIQRLSQPFAVLGRDSRCDLVLDDRRISLRHCYLQAIGSKLLCVDLGSEHGIDGGRGPARACWIDRRHEVGVGGCVIRLAGASAHAATLLESAGDSPSSEGGPLEDERLLARAVPRVALEFEANNVKTRWRMKRAVALVGSAPGCAVRLNGSSVSSYHCALVLTGLGLWAVDLLGAIGSAVQDGICVNGRRARFARLDPGDVLRVGRFRVNVRHVEWTHRSHSADSGQVAAAQPVLAEAEEPRHGVVASDLETLQSRYESHLRGLAERHNAELRSLRGEIEALRDQLDEQRHAGSSPTVRRQGAVSFLPSVRDSSESRPRETTGFRTLGTATRLSTAPCAATTEPQAPQRTDFAASAPNSVPWPSPAPTWPRSTVRRELVERRREPAHDNPRYAPDPLNDLAATDVENARPRRGIPARLSESKTVCR